MVDVGRFPFVSHLDTVEETIDLQVDLRGVEKQIRIEALRHEGGVGTARYSTRAYIWEVVSLFFPRAAGPDIPNEERHIWVHYPLPDTHGETADDALRSALSFLRERCRPGT